MNRTTPISTRAAATANSPRPPSKVQYRCRTAAAMAVTRMLSRKRLTPALTLAWNTFNGQPLHGRPCDRCAGRMKNTSISDMVRTVITTTGTTPRI